MEFLYILLVLAALGYFIYRRSTRSFGAWTPPKQSFPVSWRVLLIEKVAFYNALDPEEKKHFEFKVQEFLLNCKVTGIDCHIDISDKLLVASSAVIPIFHFKEWTYSNIDEVLIYPSSFNEKFETQGEGRSILGMVGNGYMEGKMILSKQALRLGFSNESDKKNTAVHEFVHLIDKTDGSIDGIPSLLLEKQYVLPWMDLIQKKIEDIYDNQSDINPYGATNTAEFLSVISEYFFERPQLLAKKHPELYDLLEQIFKQDMKSRALDKKKISIGRNSPCPCGSGKKFKKCCAKH